LIRRSSFAAQAGERADGRPFRPLAYFDGGTKLVSGEAVGEIKEGMIATSKGDSEAHRAK
jgi:hypothetical protein